MPATRRERIDNSLDIILKYLYGDSVACVIRDVDEIHSTETGEKTMDLILAIDDDPNILKIIEQQLQSLNYRVITSADPETGINLARTGGPSLILLDIKMPRLDGFATLKQLRSDSATSQIPVIMLSTVKDRQSVTNAMKLGVSDYMVKPCVPTVLGKKIETALNYYRMKKDIKADERGSNIVVTRGPGRTILSIETSLSDKRFMDDLKAIFHKGFLVMTSRDLIVLDLRPLEKLAEDDFPVLNAIFSFLKGRNVYIISGRHYGTIVSAFDLPESVKLFISPGDMELEIKGNL